MRIFPLQVLSGHLLLSALLTGFLSFQIPGQLIAQETFETREQISGVLPLSGGWSLPESGTRWFSWNAPADGWFTFEVNMPVGADTQIAAFYLHTSNSLVPIGDNYVIESPSAPVTFYAKAGASVIFRAFEGFAPGAPASFTWKISAAGAPLTGVRDFAVSATSVDLSSGSVPISLTFQMMVPPGISLANLNGGVSLVPAVQSADTIPDPCNSLEHFVFWSAEAALQSGNAQDGTYQVNMELPVGMSPGFYTFKFSANYSNPDTGEEANFGYHGSPAAYLPAASSIVLQVANTGIIDLTAPVLLGFTVAPSTVVFAPGEETKDVQFSFHVSDDASGLKEGSLSLGGRGELLAIHDLALVGDARDGTYTGIVTLPRSSTIDGTFPFGVKLIDGLGRRSIWHRESDLELFSNEYYASCLLPLPANSPAELIIQGTNRSLLDEAREGYDDSGAPVVVGVLDDSDGDGVPLLLEYAFGFSWKEDRPEDGDALSGNFGLPVIELNQESGSSGVLSITYIRRKSAPGNTGVSYIPQFSSDGLVWESPVVTEVVEPAGPGLERVTVLDSPPAHAERRFGRVKVTSP